MTPASKSIYYFGFYLLLTGITLIVAPNMLLGMVGMPLATEPWIRVLGSVVITIGLYYVLMAPANHRLFQMLTVYLRFSILVWFVTFSLLGIAPMQLILFGLVDAAGAIWTLTALKKS